MRALTASLAVLALATSSVTAAAQPKAPATMARVGHGTYRPLYPPSPVEGAIPVKAFLLDRLPVTEGQFAAFVLAHPEWRRDHVPRIFADPSYLSHWATADAPGADVGERQPVVEVSWFAAKAYCAARGARLPTEAEWELAAAASRMRADAHDDAPWREQVLAWYSRPNPARLPDVGSEAPNYWGIRDLYGVVWEWVLDFDASMVAVDARRTGDRDRSFCGGGAITAKDKADYPSFMRAAFRSALHADYTTHNLGFRCAADERRTTP